jgi:hypothetical protein
MNSSNNKTQMSGKKNSDSKFMMMAATSDIRTKSLSESGVVEIYERRRKKLAQMMD